MTSKDPSQTDLDEVIDHWKEAVLDLSRRNSLVDFTETKTKSLPLIGPGPVSVAIELSSEGSQSLRRRPSDDPEGDAFSGGLVADRSPEAAAETLREIERHHRRYLRERGVDTLYLSLGRLQWTTATGSEPLSSPLFLLPVEFETRPTNGTEFHDSVITYDGEPAVVNPALRKKLRVERDIVLPLDEAVPADELEDAFAAADDVAASIDGWSVSRTIALCVFDFADISLYEDIERNRNAIARDPIVRAIAGDHDALDGTDVNPRDDAETERARNSRYQVLEADPSQRRAIDAAVAGESFVLHGPPGTGKSQTIANIIAEKLARGDRVLFVSEKQAALDVVKNRLDEVGLGQFCLEVHGRHATRSSVVDSLESELHAETVRPPDELDAIREERRAVQNKLSGYAELLTSPPDGFEVTPYEALGIVARTRDAPTVDAAITSPFEHDQAAVDDAIERLAELATYEDPIRNRETHPWRHATIETWQVDTRERMERSLDRQLEALESLRALANRSETRLGIAFDRPADIERVRTALERFAFVPEAHWSTALLDPAFYGRESRARRLAEAMVEITTLERELRERYRPEIFDEDGHTLHRQLRGYGSLRYVRPSYYELRRRLRSAARDGYEPTLTELREDARTLRTLQSLRETVRALDVDDRYLEPFDDGNGVDWTVMVGTQDVLDALASQDGVEFALADDGVTRADLAAVGDLYRELNRIADAFDSAIEFFDRSMAVTAVEADGRPLDAATIDARIRYLEHLRSNLDRLQPWIQFRNRRADAATTIAGEYLENFLDAGHDPAWLVDGFRREFYRAWLNALYDRTPLSSFNATEFEHHLKTYRRLDRDAMDCAGDAVRNEVIDRRRTTDAASADSSDFVSLKREINKQRNYRPLRELFSDAGSAVQELKPCFMMSPRSVARCLPHGEVGFDAVIFDEASQIPPANAVSALIRAEQVIVAGDSNQLPPTRFFETDVRSANDDRVDLESILDEAAAVLPEYRLSWHYRSRSPALVEFSNHRYYDGRLQTFPGPELDANAGFDFEYVADGVYDRGGSRTNPREAERVVDVVEAHAETDPHRSLGVVAFSRAQAHAIADRIDDRRAENSALDSFVGETDVQEEFFVKSLEVVQGDERDRIVFSVGYGPDEDGTVTNHFGPLNEEGGERRLNVAITRARRQVTVVSSLQPEAIDTSRTDSRGVEDFCRYLEYVRDQADESRPGEGSAIDTDADPTFDTPMQADVYETLTAEGFDVDPAPGGTNAALDMAIRDPEDADRYALGIECDGSVYRQTDDARGRDRLRQRVLADRGWTVHRVWAPAWATDPDREADRIATRVAEAVANRTDDSPSRDDLDTDLGFASY